MMVWLANSFEVFRQSLLGLLRGRMTWLMGLMIPGLCVFGLLLPEEATEDIYGTDLFGIITAMFYLQMALPFSAMFFGVQTVHGDIEDRTSPNSGLGLAIAQRLAERQGGRVTADSEGPGRGSTFVLRLPGDGSPSSDASADGRVPVRARPPTT